MLIRVTKVAQILDCPKARVYEIARSPEKFGLPPGVVFRFGESVRFNEEKLRQFLNGVESHRASETEEQAAAPPSVTRPGTD